MVFKLAEGTDPKEPDEPFVPSKGLIAAEGEGLVLQYTGSSISWHIGEFSRQLDDLGLGDAPDGLSIWEGEMGSYRHRTADGDDWDFEANGKFRPLTPEELATFAAGNALWGTPP